MRVCVRACACVCGGGGREGWTRGAAAALCVGRAAARWRALRPVRPPTPRPDRAAHPSPTHPPPSPTHLLVRAQLLASSTLSDVQESIALLLACKQFEVDGAPATIRKMLPLIFARDQGEGRRGARGAG